MKSDEILKDLEELVQRLRMRLMYLQTENEKLKVRILELKKFVRDK